MTALSLPGLGIASGAEISRCGRYRYLLWRTWDSARAPLTFVMLNPSTADATEDDATVRKVIRMARHIGFGGIRIVNLFALRSRDPVALVGHHDPVGPDNDAWIKAEARESRTVVCAWGTHSAPVRRLIRGRAFRILRIFAEHQLYALNVTREGEPGHPLFLPDSTALQRWP